LRLIGPPWWAPASTPGVQGTHGQLPGSPGKREGVRLPNERPRGFGFCPAVGVLSGSPRGEPPFAPLPGLALRLPVTETVRRDIQVVAPHPQARGGFPVGFVRFGPGFKPTSPSPQGPSRPLTRRLPESGASRGGGCAKLAAGHDTLYRVKTEASGRAGEGGV
jgi:hypothetical protein